MAREMQSEGSDVRSTWEKNWSETSAENFAWHASQAPAELRALLDGGTLPSGAALDLGSGAGGVTEYLSRFFAPAVGIEIAFAAAHQARTSMDGTAGAPRFLVGEVPVLPFRSDAFSVVFDRGCMQHVPLAKWPDYFREAERLLKPGGVLMFYCPQRTGGTRRVRLRRALSRRGLRHPLRAFGGAVRGSSRQPSPHRIARTIPTLELLEARDIPFPLADGRMRTFTYGLYRKTSHA